MALLQEISVSGAIEPTNLSTHKMLIAITPYCIKWKGKFKLGHRFYGFKARIEHALISVRVACEEGGADWCAVEAEF